MRGKGAYESGLQGFLLSEMFKSPSRAFFPTLNPTLPSGKFKSCYSLGVLLPTISDRAMGRYMTAFPERAAEGQPFIFSAVVNQSFCHLFSTRKFQLTKHLLSKKKARDIIISTLKDQSRKIRGL